MEIQFNVSARDYVHIQHDIANWWIDQATMTPEEIEDECFGIDQSINLAQMILRTLKIWSW